MCGIVAAAAAGDVVPALLEGLRRLEYRGYDSAGLALVENGALRRVRCPGKVAELERRVAAEGFAGAVGIAHTRWATHGAPSESNAHPHIAGAPARLAVVHNGIIENHAALRCAQEAAGLAHESQTDSEVLACQVGLHLEAQTDLRAAVAATLGELEGSYAFAALDRADPGVIVAARSGSPLLIGQGAQGHYLASDAQALAEVCTRYLALENGDVARLNADGVTVHAGKAEVERPWRDMAQAQARAGLGDYAHYMQKEIFEQPDAVAQTLEGRIETGRVADEALGTDAARALDAAAAVQIVACGTSYHAGLIARDWFEGIARIPCRVELASEFRYREHVRGANTLFLAISQSGETADTLAALELAGGGAAYHATLAVCNVADSTMARESDLTLLTHAGPEIGVASTKAFTTQLAALLLVVILLGRRHGLSDAAQRALVAQLAHLPVRLSKALELDSAIAKLAERFAEKSHVLFLGRGMHYPVAMEGALKLKEISYIHAEAYAAGELKHGPLALVDAELPVVAVAPNDRLLAKLKSNLEEVRARGGRLYVFADRASGFVSDKLMTVFELDAPESALAPLLFTVPLQLLAYHCARIKGTDIDQPRNLAKSVTVE